MSDQAQQEKSDMISLSHLVSGLSLTSETGRSVVTEGVQSKSTKNYSVIEVVVSKVEVTHSQTTVSEEDEKIKDKEQSAKPKKDDDKEKKDQIVEQPSSPGKDEKTTEKKKETEKKEKAKHVVLTVEKPLTPAVPTKLQRFAESLGNAKNVIVMVGAGLSCAPPANIPDFRTPGTGLYSQLAKYNLPHPEAVFEINFFKKNPEPFRKLASELWPGVKHLPTLGHYFIKLLHDKNKLLRCFTQNIDSLEAMTGLPEDKIIAAHGNFASASCVYTRKKITDMEEVKRAYLNSDHESLNKKYGTKLVKPDIVFFGESLPERFLKNVPIDFPKCDLLIVMGTSLQVQPFASLITMPPRNTPRLLINRERVGEHGGRSFNFRSMDSMDYFLKGDCDDGCEQLAEALGWGQELQDLVKQGAKLSG